MNKYKISKVVYKMLFTLKGTCPHCNKEIDQEKIEEFSDEYPPDSYFTASAALFQHNMDEYFKFIEEHPTFVNLMKVSNEWRDNDKIGKTLSAVSKVRSEAVYVLEGDCPYCLTPIILREPYRININAPPQVEPGELQATHLLEHCPKCGKTIHIYKGFFQTGWMCCPQTHKKDIDDADKDKLPPDVFKKKKQDDIGKGGRHKQVNRSNEDLNPMFWLNCHECGADLKEHPFRIRKYECECQICGKIYKLPRWLPYLHPLKPWKDDQSMYCDDEFLEQFIGKKPADARLGKKDDVKEPAEKKEEKS